MKKLLLLLALLTMPSSALAAGDPDYEFGRGGRVLTPAPLQGPWSKTSVGVAEAPDGGILVGGAATVTRYLPSGEIDPAFGRGGILAVGLPSVARFRISDLTVDSSGRIIVFGTSTRVGPKGRASSAATILRYLPDGEPDVSFGGDGAVMTNFGLRSQEGARATVTASLGSLDTQGRIVLVAGVVRRTSVCGKSRRLHRRDRLVARFTAAGALDPSFGRGGLRRLEPLEAVTDLAIDRGGGIVLAGSVPRLCSRGPELAVVRLRADGNRRKSFGDGGTRRLTGSVAAIAIDRRDRVTVLCKEKQTPVRDEHLTKLVRLLPSGRLDPSFDENGRVVYEFKGPRYQWSSLLIDGDGRLLLVGTLIRPLPPEKQHDGQLFHRWFMVMPLREDGRQPGGFGYLGWLAITRFDPSSDAAASDALIDREGKLLIAGTVRSPKVAPRGGFALARFELWS